MWGEHIFAKVVALNVYGPSEESDVGDGAEIITYADAPVSLAEDYSQRTATSVRLVWSEGAANGGSTVISYQLVYDNASGTDFVILESNIVDLGTNVLSLTSGLTYNFKVQALNSFGLSVYSDTLTIVAGFKPEKPSSPTTTNTASNILLQWTEPVDNGSPITSYRITIV